MRPKGLIIAGVVAAILVATTPSPAHHGFTGRYDLSQPVWLEGEVARGYFGQPHPEVTVRIDPDLTLPTTTLDLAGAGSVIAAGTLAVRPDTVGRAVTVEFPPIRVFFDLGRSVAVGDRVAVIAFRNCDAPHQMRGQWIKPMRSGPVARSGRVQYQVGGC